MNEASSLRMLFTPSLKLMAGGVSVLALALLALLAVGFFSDTSAPAGSSQQVSTSKSPNTEETSSAPSSGPALHAAIAEGGPGMVRILVEAGGNVDAKNAFGDPALRRAILKENSEMVRVLVAASADVNVTNAFGDSALSLAVHEGDGESCEFWLLPGAAKAIA